MKWIVKIEEKPELRIVIQYDPIMSGLSFIGEYKHIFEWTEFHRINSIIHLDSEKIKELLFDTYKELNYRVGIFKSLNEEFSDIKLIEINEI